MSGRLDPATEGDAKRAVRNADGCDLPFEGAVADCGIRLPPALADR
jgi:hypothetical protein